MTLDHPIHDTLFGPLVGLDRRQLLQTGLAVSFSCGLPFIAAAKTICPRSLTGEPLVWRLSDLETAKSNADPSLLENLKREADEALQRGPYSVTDKQRPPPSGDLKDYTSLGPYWWPDPDTADGTPYIRRDGQTNPERNGVNFDRIRIYDLMRGVQTLSLAFWFTENPAYAAHAVKLLQVWFVDPETSMNPNMNYAQAIPGRTEGRGIGIIDTHRMGQLIDATQLLARTGQMDTETYQAIRRWFSDYTRWLVTSPLGKDERATKNNHGTYYDLQLIHYALFIGDCDFAQKRLRDVKSRIDAQITSRGRMPLEEARTRSLHYYVFNTLAFLQITRLAEHLDVNLSDYEGRRGQSVLKTLLYLAPYLGRDEDWPHKQIGGSSQKDLARLMIFASAIYDDPDIQSAARQAYDSLAGDTSLLTLPSLAVKP